ncbi:MAG: oligoendopeptidase F [Oscillospiraceae bacterium]|nr:oligoendopeptidase F [Oscillospiraceae bacterium]
MSKLIERKDQQPEYTWALEDIFPTDEAWEQALEEARGLAEETRALEGQLGSSGEKLLESMKLSDRISVAFQALANYAARRADEDTRVAKYQAMTAKVSALAVELNTAGAYEDNEILAIDEQRLEEFYRSVPELEVYRLRLQRLRRKKEHILSPAEESLLAGAGELAETPGNIFTMLSDADMPFEDAVDSQGRSYPLSHGSYGTLLQSKDRELRRSAYEHMYDAYGRFRNTSAAVLGAQNKQLAFFAKARKYASPLEAALDRTEVPAEVYRNLIDAVHANFPKLHRYVSLRKKLLGVEELRFYDLYTPMVEGVEMKVSFPEAKELALEALRVLGEDYLAMLREGFENRWIDVYENVGKRSGAYAVGARVHPFVLLNYQGNLTDAFTLVHEMGHALHSYLSNTNQPVAYSRYVIFVAEVASTCNEALLMQYLLGRTRDRKERAYLINYFLEQFRTIIYRQTMFAEFELKVSEMNQRGEGVTAEALCALYRKLNEDYFGPDVVVDDRIALEWARIPHFYYNFYVYQYSTGYAAAIALSRKILSEGESAVRAYLDFLSSGCSADPISLLKKAGVDMTTAQPIDQALELFDQLITELEELMAE